MNEDGWVSFVLVEVEVVVATGSEKDDETSGGGLIVLGSVETWVSVYVVVVVVVDVDDARASRDFESTKGRVSIENARASSSA